MTEGRRDEELGDVVEATLEPLEPASREVVTVIAKRGHSTTSLALGVVASSLVTVATVLFFVPSCMAQTGTVITASSIQAGVPAGPAVAVVPVAPASPARPAATPGEVGVAAGLQNAYVLRGSPGDAYMVVDLTPFQVPTGTVRPAMSVALVVDRSGSMAGDKIQNAILAASSFINNLADGDVVSLFQYDDVVEQLAPPTPVNASTRPMLMAALSQLYPRGSTNLHGGLQAGIASLLRPESERPLRRVVLISDGLANVGPSSPFELGLVASAAAASGVTVTSIGVGLDYDESVLGAVAARSGGRFYHLQEPMQMAAILESELQALTLTVARNVIIDVVPAPGVTFVEATGADVVTRGDQIRLRVGELLGGQPRPVVVSLRVPTDGAAASRDAARLAVSYTPIASNAPRRTEASVGYALTASQAQVDGSVNPRFALAVEEHQAALASLQAAQALNAGRSDEAADMLAQAADRMEARAQRMPTAERAHLNQQAQRMRVSSDGARRARSAPARRASSLSINDSALDGLGL
jgi:Ca-activated chloride channel homolog